MEMVAQPDYNITYIVVIPTSREEPVSMLDNGLNDANNL